MTSHNFPVAGQLTIQDALARAHAHWHAGQAQQAEQLCLRVLQAAPHHPDAAHLLGLMAHAYGKTQMAIDFLRQACAWHGVPATYFSNLAEMCRQQGLLEEAEQAARKAVAQDAQLVAAWNNLGIILQQRGQLDAALECLQRVARLMPDSAEAHNNLANTYKLAGQPSQAMAHFQRALALKPHYVEAHSNLSVVLADLGRDEEAVSAARRAIEIDPQFKDAYANLARAEAAWAQRTGRSAPQMGAAPEPSLIVDTVAQSRALLDAGRFAEAEALLRPYLSSRSGPLDLWRQLFHAVRAQGKIGEARQIIEMLVQAVPADMNCRFDLAEVLLLQGEFERGWREYRFRYKLDHTVMMERHVQATRWEGQDIAGKTLLIHDEQGYGDTFQFLRLVAWARERSGARVVLEVNPESFALAERSGGYDEIVPLGQIPPPFDVHCELMSLPLALDLRLDQLPGRVPYLSADPQRVEKWRARLAGLPRPLVGLVWAGRPTHVNDARRSLALADLAPLAQEGVSFVALQKGPAAAQAAAPPEGMLLLSLSDEIDDFDDTAAILSLLDVLVSIDSSPVHLAGALGCPAWVMLPFMPDWRWLLERADTPWYPSLRLFRQPAPDAWAPVLASLAAALGELRDKTGGAT